MIVVNAGTTDKDKKWIKSHLSRQTHFEDISPDTAKLDLQGPSQKISCHRIQTKIWMA